MTARDLERLEALYLGACELTQPARSRFLDEHCAGDAVLRSQVEQLLRSGDDGEQAMARTGPAGLALLRGLESALDAITPGTRLGDYVIRERIGEGGFGIVYRAEQQAPVRRDVALKLMRPGLGGRAMLGRFDVERQALALMDHENIARIFEGGVTEDGRPFFAMEFIEGTPITDYCHTEGLDTEQRIALLQQTCHGVQHAHQKGVIHRDLKPGNILVARQDGRPIVKIIDFGIAKAVGEQLTEQTELTARGQFVGTLDYMAPEQLTDGGRDIDTRVDIYSLGAVLYEVLTGHRPFELDGADFEELLRTIRQDAPPRPSARLRPEGGEAADRRGTDSRSLAQQLRVDLDWITLKALEKDRDRRYASANDLAADLARHRNHAPVLARPPSTTYRLKKFVRRNRTLVSSLSAIGIISLAAITTVLAVLSDSASTLEDKNDELKQANSDLGHANTELRVVTDEARQSAARAEHERDVARAINEFINEDLLAAPAPSLLEGRGKDVLMRDALDIASERIERRFGDQPEIAAAILGTIGRTHSSLGDFRSAEPHLQRALELRRRHLGPTHPDTLHSMTDMALLHGGLGRYEQAEPLLLECLAAWRTLRGDGSPEVLDTTSELATLYLRQDRHEEAERLFLICLDGFGAIDPQGIDTLGQLNNLALLFMEKHRYDEAEDYLKKCLDQNRGTTADTHPETLASLANLAGVYLDQGLLDKAEPLVLEHVERCREVFDADHPLAISSLNVLTQLRRAQGRYEEAREHGRECLARLRATVGNAHRRTLIAMSSLAQVCAASGTHFPEAEALFIECLEGRRAILGEHDPDTTATRCRLGSLYLHSGRLEEAERHLTECVRQRRAGSEGYRTLRSMFELTSLFMHQGRDDDATPLLLDAMTRSRTLALLDGEPRAIAAVNEFAELLVREGRLAEAELVHHANLETARAALGDDHVDTFSAKANLANTYYLQERYAQAEPFYIECLERSRAQLGDEHSETLTLVNNLAFVCFRLGDLERAEPLMREVIAGRTRILGADDRATLGSVDGLAELLLSKGRYVDAEPVLTYLVEQTPEDSGNYARRLEVLEFVRKTLADERAARDSAGG